MTLKSILAVATAVAAIFLTAAFAALHSHIGSGFKLAEGPAYRFEPQPIPMAANARRPVVGSSIAGGLYALTVEGPTKTVPLTCACLMTVASIGCRLSASPPQGAPSTPPLRMVLNSSAGPCTHTHSGSSFPCKRLSSSHRALQRHGRHSSVGVPVTDTDPAAKSYAGFPSLGLAPNGDVYAVWLDGRDKGSPGTLSVYLARSTDKGLTFHKNVKVASDSCPCCRPSIAFGPDGKVYVAAYRHVYSDNERDIAVATSAIPATISANPSASTSTVGICSDALNPAPSSPFKTENSSSSGTRQAARDRPSFGPVHR